MQVTTLSPTFTGFPAVSTLTFLPIATISPVPSCPSATGIRLNGSLLNSCASVPHTPHPSTLTRISSSPIGGIGYSLMSKCSFSVNTATLAVFGIPVDAAGAEAAAGAFPVMPERTCFTISSIFTLFMSMFFLSLYSNEYSLSVHNRITVSQFIRSDYLSNTETVFHDAASSLCECACTGKTFACTACNCKCSISF